MKILKLLLAAVFSSVLALGVSAQQAPITLHGASQFGDDHAFTKAMVRFEELVNRYYGKPINFVLHKNSSLGLEKDYFAYMNQGKAVDYAIVSAVLAIALGIGLSGDDSVLRQLLDAFVTAYRNFSFAISLP